MFSIFAFFSVLSFVSVCLSFGKKNKGYRAGFVTGVGRVWSREVQRVTNHLIPVQLTASYLSFALLLECENDQGHKDVEKKKRKNYNKAHVINSVTGAVVVDWTLVWGSCGHSSLHITEKER